MTEKMVTNVEQENRWDELHFKYADDLFLRDFDGEWEKVVLDTANRLKYMRYFPDRVGYHSFPISFMKELNEWYDKIRVAWDFSYIQMITLTGWLYTKHRAFFDDYAEQYKEDTMIENFTVAEFVISVMDAALEKEGEIKDDKNEYYEF